MAEITVESLNDFIKVLIDKIDSLEVRIKELELDSNLSPTVREKRRIARILERANKK